MREVRSALALQVGDQRQAVGPGLGGQSQLGQPVMVHAQHAGRAVEHA